MADDGFYGAWWQRHWQRDYQAVVLTARNYTGDTAQALRRQHHSRRQIVETVNGRLEGTFNLNFPQAHTPWGTADSGGRQGVRLEPGHLAEPSLRPSRVGLRHSLQLLKS